MRASVLKRLEKLEKEYQFTTWFLGARFIESLTDNELDMFRGDNLLTDPLPSRPSPLDKLDRKSLEKKWQEDESAYAYRTSEEFDYFCDHGDWPEQLQRLDYSNENGGLSVRLQGIPPRSGVAPDSKSKGTPST